MSNTHTYARLTMLSFLITKVYSDRKGERERDRDRDLATWLQVITVQNQQEDIES